MALPKSGVMQSANCGSGIGINKIASQLGIGVSVVQRVLSDGAAADRELAINLIPSAKSRSFAGYG